MKNKIKHITNMRLLLGFTTIAVLSTAVPIRAGKPSRGGGGSGGLPYATASTVSELVADINYANGGGATTFELAPGTTFDLPGVNNSDTNGNNGLPVIGGTQAVNLTIICNGDTIECADVYEPGKRGTLRLINFRQFDVAAGSSLTLDNVALQGGRDSAVFNQGTLNIINGSTVTDDSGLAGGGIYNAGGTMTVSNSIVSYNSSLVGGCIYNDNGIAIISGCMVDGGVTQLSGEGTGIYNNGGTMAIIDSTVSSNYVNGGYGAGIYNEGGTLSISNSTLDGNDSAFFGYTDTGGGYGGAIYNNGGTVAVDYSTLSGNSADIAGGAIYSPSGTLTVNHSIISRNEAPGVNEGDGGYNFSGAGGGIANGGTLTVENSSQITGNGSGDVDNGGTLYEDSSSEIGILIGNPAIMF